MHLTERMGELPRRLRAGVWIEDSRETWETWETSTVDSGLARHSGNLVALYWEDPRIEPLVSLKDFPISQSPSELL